MSMTSPRGPLPARVYWVRRSLVVLVALALVFGIGKLLTGFGGDPKATTASAPAAAPRSSQPTGSASTGVPSPQPTAASTKKGAKVPLSVPTGTCDPARITVTPNLTKVDGGGTVALPMALTSTDGTCTWRVSPQALVLKIVSGTDRIWSSQDCSTAIPTQDVVVRPAEEKATVVDVTWSGRRSAQDCPKGNGWADVGYYHAIAATLGGTPSDVQFQVVGPPRPVVTKTTHPKPTKRPTATKTPAG